MELFFLNPGPPPPDSFAPPPPIVQPYAFALLAAALAAFFVGLLAFQGTRKAFSRYFGFFQFAVFLWCIFRFALWGIPSPGDQMLALEFQYIGISFLPTTAFLFAKSLTGRPVRSRFLPLLLLPSILTVLLVFTHTLHRFFWYDGGYAHSPVIRPEPGPGFWLFIAYEYCLMIVSIAIIARVALRARGIIVWWLALLCAIFALPLAVNAVYVFCFQGVSDYDPTPLVYSGFGLLVWMILRRYNLFDVIPYTANILTESLGSSILVTDKYGYAIGANMQGKGLLSPDAAIEGKSAAQLCPVLEGLSPGSSPRSWSSGGREYLVSANEVVEGKKRLPGAIFVFRDVTALVRATRELEEAKARADAANAAKSAFVATVSHELRNPLNAIIGLSDLNLRSSLPRELEEDFEVIQASGNILLGLVNDLLDLSKIEAGKMELESVDFDLHEKAVSMLKAFRPAVEKKGIFLDITVEEGTPRFVKGDPLRYGQVLMNLVSNAVKFTELGAVAVSISAFPGPAEAEGGTVADPRRLWVRTSVRDTGIGVAADKLPRLFKEFSQADGSISRRFGGTGLGLSISARIVELLGGEIEVQSAEGLGSTFSFTARFEEGSEDRAIGSRVPDAVGAAVKALRILVVDDDPVNGAVAKRYLDRFGHESANASTGTEALEMLRLGDFDLVLLDLGLPDMDGFEACRLIRSEARADQAGSLPIAAMTARSEAGLRGAVAAAGMIDCVPKPIDPAHLERLLDRVAGIAHELGPRAAASVHPSGIEAGNRRAASLPPAVAPGAPLVDETALLGRLDGDAVFLRELLGIFVDEAQGRREAYAEALAARNLDSLQRQGHALKGSSLSLCADPLGVAAGAVEAACIDAKRLGVGSESAIEAIGVLVADVLSLLVATVAAAEAILGEGK
jgi:signal transduction histidine kinase/CheY-like chemotaxis protein